jgi:hypothetical protein
VPELGALTAGDFEPLMGEDFHLSECSAGGQSVHVRLVEVLRQRERAGHRQPFAVHFVGPEAPVLYQDVHRLSHPQLGEIECLIGPVMSDAPGVTYEAIFS